MILKVIDMKRSDRAVHKVLLEQAVDNRVHLTLQQIAAAADYCPRAVQYALDNLEAERKIRRLNSPRRLGMTYEILLADA